MCWRSADHLATRLRRAGRRCSWIPPCGSSGCWWTASRTPASPARCTPGPRARSTCPTKSTRVTRSPPGCATTGSVRDGLIIGANQYGDRTIFADNWPDRAHLWLASQDHPSDKATVAFHVQAPVDDQVIANGVLEKIDTLAVWPRGLALSAGYVRFRCTPWWSASAVWRAPRLPDAGLRRKAVSRSRSGPTRRTPPTP